MTKIELGIADGKPITIDLDTLISTRLLVTASSGGGKSETLRRIIEEASQHVQCIVIDPEGEFATLRERYPFVLVGEGGDVPADIRTAELVASKLLELHANAVCDLYEMKPVHNRHVWVQRFLNALVHAPKELWHPVLVILDEAHVYSPEKGYSESCANEAVMNLASLGRKRGFSLIAATQRLSKLNKNTVEPLQNFIVGQTTYDDQKRAASIFKIEPGAPTRQFSLELERLMPGQFIVRGRAFNKDMARVKITRGKTRPPATGSELAGRVIPAPETIRHLLPQLADLPHLAEAQENNREEVQRELRVAHGEIMRLSEELEAAGRKAGAVEAELEKIRETLRQAQHVARQLVTVLESNDIERVMLETIKEIRTEAAAGDREALALLPALPPVHSDTFTPAPAYTNPDVDRQAKRTNGKDGLRPGTRRMLAALVAWHPKGRTEGQVATASRLTRKGGSWTSYKSELNTLGLIEVKDGLMYATSTGLAFFGNSRPETPKTTADVIALWSGKLRPGARRMLAALVRVKGNTLSRSTLSELSGVSDAGGSFTSYLSELRTAGLILSDKSGVRADREALFL